MKVFTGMRFLVVLFLLLSFADKAAHARQINGWWGVYDTEDWNNSEGADRPADNLPDDVLYPPSPESVPNATRKRPMTAWKWHNATNAPDPLKAGWVRGANRTVFWDAGASQPPYHQVWGYFDEPNINGVDLDRKSNKPTYYYGVKGTVPGRSIDSDCGIQWEYARNGSGDGWTLFHRVTISISERGSWELWKQSATPAPRHDKGALGRVLMTYVIYKDNLAIIAFNNSNGKEESIGALYYDPAFPIQITSIRRNVGLTQSVTAEEFGKTVTDAKVQVGTDQNAVVILDEAAVYLDGSVVSGLKFADGLLLTAPRSILPTDVEVTDPWSKAGGSDKLRPTAKADDKFIVDFTWPSSPRNPSYQTNFDTENVRIQMGAKKRRHKVKVFPKAKRRW